jgi:hypothetical protein
LSSEASAKEEGSALVVEKAREQILRRFATQSDTVVRIPQTEAFSR